MSLRLTKIALCLALAAFAFLVSFNNLTDYGSNLAFVQHVLAMDTTFPGNALRYRAISDEWLWHAAYWMIIGGEVLTFVLLLAGTWTLWQARYASGTGFDAAKIRVLTGCGVGFMVWFSGFMVIGGEWFVMWQSPQWNGQQAAFRFYMAILGVMIFVNQPDRDLSEREVARNILSGSDKI